MYTPGSPPGASLRLSGAEWRTSNAQTPVTPLAPAVLEMLQTGGFKTRQVMSNADPPVHTRIRKFTWQAFTPKRIAQLEPEVRRLVTRFLDQIEAETTRKPICHSASASTTASARRSRGSSSE